MATFEDAFQRAFARRREVFGDSVSKNEFAVCSETSSMRGSSL